MMEKMDKVNPIQESGEEERRRWRKAHKIMKASPPTSSGSGRDYLMHARSLLLLLEGIAEIHPVSKVVVASFKTIVMFETDRRDNDVRVTSVFLAQTDTMQILLDIDDLSSRQREGPDREHLKGLRSSASLASLLTKIARDIKECGNTMDAYYKESRFVKFWKSQDWKSRMLDYVDIFSRHRAHLQEILSVQVAAGVGDLVAKMDEVLSGLYRPKYEWERNLAAETRRLVNESSAIDSDQARHGLGWIEDDDKLRCLIAMTDDPAFSTLQSNPTAAQAVMRSEQLHRAELESSLIERIREKLGLSLDVICERNMDRFEVKLNFYMEQMQEAIMMSAQTIVHALSGPFDRLENQDLRELWKEMASRNWIFCVENKLFSSALFEYYLDLFSTTQWVDLEDFLRTEPNKNRAASSYLIRSLKWDKSRSLQHVDAWTLDYLVAYGDRIAAAIDEDDSGFIRISEANAFTRRMPFGWNLPQWCAYSAAGWLFEARMYRKRINTLLFKLKEAHISVLPANRSWLGYAMAGPITSDLCAAFWREPKGIRKPNICFQLKDLVKDKMLSQDAALRSKLSSLNWTIDSVSTIDILFGTSPLESFILQLIAIMLEYVLQVVFYCSKATLDVREWERIIASFDVIRQICIAQLDALQGQNSLKSNSKPDLNQFCGGIWSHFDAQLDRDQQFPLRARYDFWGAYSANEYDLVDYRDFISDSDFLLNFPVPSASDENAVRPYLEFRPWEEALQSMALDEVPSVIPNSWDIAGGSLVESNWEERHLDENINYGWYCNQCNADEPDKRYHCIECLDVDFCDKCVNISKADCKVRQHESDHPLLIISFNVMPHQIRMLEAEGKYNLDEVQYALRGRHLPSLTSRSQVGGPVSCSESGIDGSDSGSSNATDLDIQFVCGLCSQAISLDSAFYKCIGNALCKGVFVCEECAKLRKERTDQQHKWWHPLLVLRNDILAKSDEGASIAVKETEPENKPGDADAPKEDTAAASNIQAVFEARIASLEDSFRSNSTQIDERIAGLENTLKSSNLNLEERMEKLESKMDVMITKLQEWFTRDRT